MESIFKKPKLKKQTQRNAFDVSQKRVQHSPFGAIIPCFCRVVAPDDYVELSAESQFICDDLARPAFMRLKEHINFYAVPIRQLWAPFDNFITGQDNYHSSLVENKHLGEVPASCPTFTMSNILGTLSLENDEFGFNLGLNALRLLDTLEYGNYYGFFNAYYGSQPATDWPQIDINYNPFALLAYQKVYYDYYRNTKYEACETEAFNIDDISSDNGDVIDDNRLKKILRLHYAYAKKDYFTDVQPSVLPTGSDIGYEALGQYAPNSEVFGVPGASSTNIISQVVGRQDPQGFNQNIGDAVVNSSSLTPYSIQSNVTALRFAFAYDKLLRRMREAGGTFDKQMLAQFGITPYDGRDGKCIYIGGQTNRLNASDVISQSGTSENDLGFIGGNINQYSVPRGKFKYHAKEYCVIIGLYHTSLDYDYPSYQTSRFNMYNSRFDYFNPAFENLGLQPIYKYELMNLYFDGSVDWQVAWPFIIDDGSLDPDWRKVVGYQRRYAECKTNVDKVFGLFDFNLDADYNAWVAQFHPIRLGAGIGDELPLNVAPIDRRVLQFNPLMFNQIVKTEYDGDWKTDPFKNHFYIHCKLIGNMSPLGETF